MSQKGINVLGTNEPYILKGPVQSSATSKQDELDAAIDEALLSIRDGIKNLKAAPLLPEDRSTLCERAAALSVVWTSVLNVILRPIAQLGALYIVGHFVVKFW